MLPHLVGTLVASLAREVGAGDSAVPADRVAAVALLGDPTRGLPHRYSRERRARIVPIRRPADGSGWAAAVFVAVAAW
jgi:hypothetical protein